MYLSISAAPMPKRRVTIFTSSGCETSLGIGFCSFRLGFVAVVGQDAWDLIGRELVEEVVVDLDGRRPTADADALHFFEREDAIGRDALVADAQFFLKAFVQVVGSAQHAADIGADLHVEFSGGLEA